MSCDIGLDLVYQRIWDRVLENFEIDYMRVCFRVPEDVILSDKEPWLREPNNLIQSTIWSDCEIDKLLPGFDLSYMRISFWVPVDLRWQRNWVRILAELV